MNQRLQQFLAAENISQSQFADAINVARASVSHVLAGRNKPGYDFLKSITETYPQLNLDWLMTGKGKMYKNSPAFETQVVENPKFEFKPVQDDVYDEDSLFSKAQMEPEIGAADASNAVSEDFSRVIATSGRKVKKIVVLFDDGTYQELK